MSHTTDHHQANHHPRHYGGAIYVNKSKNYIDVEDELYRPKKCFYKPEIAPEVISYPTLNHHVYPMPTTTPDCQEGGPTSSGNPQVGHQSPSPMALGAIFEGGGGGRGGCPVRLPTLPFTKHLPSDLPGEEGWHNPGCRLGPACDHRACKGGCQG